MLCIFCFIIKFTDCRSMYDSMLNKIEDITEENNKLMTELSKGMK